MSKPSSIWTHLGKHKILLAFLIFGVHIVFIDHNNVIRRIQRKKEILELRSEIERYQKEYEKSTIMLEELTSNPEYIERIARERYFMKEPDEDIYIFE